MTKAEILREIIKLNNENTNLKDFLELRNQSRNFLIRKKVDITYRFRKEYDSFSKTLYIKGDLKEKILNLFEQEIEENNKRIDELLGEEND